MTTDSIILIGMMGSGKSTVGKLLAEELGYEFVDMDSLIEESEGKLISEIFAQDGEGYFRQIESQVLAEFAQKEKHVISCGGGVVEQIKNFRVLKKTRNTFFLDADPQILYERISGDGSRPKLSTYEEFEKLYMERKSKYNYCSRHLVHADRNPIKVVQDIMRLYENRSKFGV